MGAPGPVRPPWAIAEAAVQLEPGEELIAGRRPVEEAFAARRPAHRLYVVPQRRAPLEALVLHATTLRIPVVEIEGGSLTALAGFDGHQGVALAVAPREWATLDDVLARAAERGERPFVLALDSFEDPHNLGSLLRTAEAAGVHGVCFPTHHAAPLTPSAVKASAGAVEHLLLVPVDDLGSTLADLRAHGLRLVGADAEAMLTYREADLRGPLAMVVGSEGRGLSGSVRRRLDLTVRIPMHGRVASLNAAVAGSVLLLEAATQRGLPDVAPAPASTAEAAEEPVEVEATERPADVAAPAEALANVALRARARRAKAAAEPPVTVESASPAVDAAAPRPKRKPRAAKAPAASTAPADPPAEAAPAAATPARKTHARTPKANPPV
ncbi:MAG: 23S rRNA (guanosine(2251)-2'-O)-methyltransferase RlmB [Candidatus Limnocylindrales bacterium]